jgi:hypothetical protein
MSFEGYYQKLCTNGHLVECDVYSFDEDNCQVCKAEWVWENVVDCTNESGVGRVELEIATPAKYKTTCEACGAQQLVAEETYKIPLG